LAYTEGTLLDVLAAYVFVAQTLANTKELLLCITSLASLVV